MARLSTHVLDTTHGRPAAGMHIRLFAIEDDLRRLLKSATTNRDGRTDEPLLAGDRLVTGMYELEFDVAGYFGHAGEQPPFLREVVVRFGVSDERGNYHVPLLFSPYCYSTYRGS